MLILSTTPQDIAGNVSESSINYVWTVDLTAPVFTAEVKTGSTSESVTTAVTWTPGPGVSTNKTRHQFVEITLTGPADGGSIGDLYLPTISGGALITKEVRRRGVSHRPRRGH